MKTRIVPIGNSQGVRIPKVLLEQSKLCGDVEMEAQGDTIVIRPATVCRHPRDGWDKSLRLMVERGDDVIPDWLDAPLTAFDQTEWEW